MRGQEEEATGEKKRERMIGARGRKRSRDAREERQRSVSGHARCEDRIRPSDADPQNSRSLGSWIILERTFLLLLLSIDLTLEKDFWDRSRPFRDASLIWKLFGQPIM